MSTMVLRRPQAAQALPSAPRWGLAEWLVVGGAAVAPLNLLLVRSLTVYDCLLGLAFVVLVHERRLVAPPRPYVLIALVFLAAAVLSAFRATYVMEALTQALQYLFVFFVLIPVVLSVVRTRRLVMLNLLVLCAATLGAVLHAYLTQSVQAAGRVMVFYSDNPNRLGYPTAYLIPFLLLIWLAARSLRPPLRFLTAVACLASAYLAVWALAASASRSSVVGTLVAVIVFAVLRPALGVGRMLLRAGILVAVIAGLATGLAATGQLPTTLQERIQRTVSGDYEDRTALVGDRKHLAIAGLRAFVDSPYIGTGLDNFRYVSAQYDIEATPQVPHNVWLQLLAQVGVFGALAAAALFLLWGRDMAQAYRHAEPLDRHLLWALVAALAGILTILLFAPEMRDRHYWLIFALGLAAVAGVRQHRREVVTS